jgi:pyridinium-3,5-biscarboxylic acid mononucleotide sulfurtransferase
LFFEFPPAAPMSGPRDHDLEEKTARCRGILRRSAPLLVAYSGGVDSACLLALAHGELGGGAHGVIADSPSLPRAALDEALKVAGNIGARVEVVRTAEFSDERYLANPPNRCYFCKAELFSKMESLARERGFRHIAYGENADDPADLRPGSRAAAEFRVLAPLKEAGLTKSDIRELSRRLGLPTHDAPAQPCLSSRIPHGTRVTAEALGMVERGEAALRELGFRVLRVRYLEGPQPAARVQIDPAEMPRGEDWKKPVAAALEGCGFARVEIDPAGYRAPGTG